MIFSLHGQGRPLSEEIQEAEQRLALRRRELRHGMHALDLGIRKRVTSPDILLWGVATGFIAGELTKKRPAPQEAEEHAAEDARKKKRGPSTLQLLLRYWAIARPIVVSVSGLLSPFLNRAANEADNESPPAEAEAEAEAAAAANDEQATQQAAGQAA